MVANEDDIRSADAGFDRAGFWIAAASGTLLSLALTGFVFAINNNLYHLPIVAELYDEPQFTRDAFVQSLRYYAAGPWILLRGSASYVNPYWSFLFLFTIGRFLAFAGFLACARMLGIERRKEQLFFSILISTTFLLRGVSLAGDGGLFINYFTHSEIANGLFLLVLYLTLRHRIAAAMTMVGVIFFINAFIGVWTIVVWGPVLLVQVLRGDLTWRQVVLRASIGLCIAGLFAAPVVANILSNPEFGKPLDFDYVLFLNEHFPYHFLFGPIDLSQKIGLAFITMIGLGAFIQLGKPARLWLVALLAVCAIYVVGIFTPYATHSQTILNLTLLRSSTFIHLLSALAVCALATSWWFAEDRIRTAIAAPILVAALTVPAAGPFRNPMIIVLLGVILLTLALVPITGSLSRHVPDILARQGSRLRIAMTLWFVCVISGTVVVTRLKIQKAQEWIAEWQTIGAWARENTPVNAIFMNPIVIYNPPKIFTDEDIGGSADTIFEYTAHRIVWVDFKRGSAVMWSPSYYDIWHRRVSEESSLITHQDKLDYAQKNGVSYVIEVCIHGNREKIAFATKRICVYAVTQPDDSSQ